MKAQRIKLEFSEEMLEELKDKCGLSEYRDLFNNALTILDWAVEECKAGHGIASIDKEADTYSELSMPVLSRAKDLK